MRNTGRWVGCTLGLVAWLWGGAAHAQFTPVGHSGLTSIDYMLLDRELTLDADIVELGGRLQTIQIDLGGFFSTSITSFAFALGYGVADVLEIWAEPVLMIDPQAELGLALGASVRAVDTESFDMAPSFMLPINVTGDGDKVSYMVIGLDSRIRLGSVVSLFLLHGLVEPVFAGDTVILQANLGLGLQLVEIVGLRFETRPLALETADGDVLHYGDVVPFSFDVLVTAGSVDCFLGLAFPDLGDAGDYYVLTLGAMGRI